MRIILDKIFTITAWFCAIMMIVILGIYLLPMFSKGVTAVVFQGTVEFRELQLVKHGRGDEKAVQQELEKSEKLRNELRAIISEFRKGMNREAIGERIRDIYKDYKDELKNKGIEGDQYRTLYSKAKEIRNAFCDLLESNDNNFVLSELDKILAQRNNLNFESKLTQEMFRLAENYKHNVEKIDLARQSENETALVEIEGILNVLFGPELKSDSPAPLLAKDQFGMTRWDMVERQLNLILYEHKWVTNEENPDGPLVMESIPRKDIFAGTVMADFFVRLENEAEDIFKPRLTIYWNYFTDDNESSYFIGGVGPEIYGTIILTVMSMVFVIPFGIITAAWLVECARENIFTSIIRMSINSLAGVPSIVFGMFGMAFFVLWAQPQFEIDPEACILAGSLTLALLTLPVMIRSSEEAIRSVPQTYKEASLGLGAGRTRTFILVTLPAALPGILTGIILSLSRVAGETAPVLLTAAVAVGEVPDSILDPTRTLATSSYYMAIGDRIAAMVPHKQFGMVVTLITMVLLLNAAAIILRARIFKKLKGH